MVDLDDMDSTVGVYNIPPRGVESIHKKLVELYSRRSAVESLIRCLESYAACQVKNGNHETAKSA